VNLNIIFGAIILSGGLYFFISDNTVSDTIKNDQQLSKKDTIESKKQIKILYIDENSNDLPQVAKTTEQKKYIQNKKEIVYQDNFEPEEIVDYIKQKGLIKHISKNRKKDDYDMPPPFSIYSDISEKDAKIKYDKQQLPPPAPAIVNSTTSDGTVYTVVIPPYINAMSKEIIVSSNDTEGDPETLSVIRTPTQNSESETNDNDNEQTKIVFTSPPSIGQ
jgi:hypothetical protein